MCKRLLWSIWSDRISKWRIYHRTKPTMDPIIAVDMPLSVHIIQPQCTATKPHPPAHLNDHENYTSHRSLKINSTDAEETSALRALLCHLLNRHHAKIFYTCWKKRKGKKLKQRNLKLPFFTCDMKETIKHFNKGIHSKKSSIIFPEQIISFPFSQSATEDEKPPKKLFG